ncbi:ionotropic receptor 93a-like [Palaemon carinicauda]|uniref:ionotropic receptor 93a-like n=1 Tax=Palaemon carinicauda TaxID=392227 RepID=UPI0035B60C0C
MTTFASDKTRCCIAMCKSRRLSSPMKFPSVRCVPLLFAVALLHMATSAIPRPLVANNDTHQEVAKVLQMTGFSSSDSHIIFTDGSNEDYQPLALELIMGKVFHGVALFNTKAGHTFNNTELNQLTSSALKVRIASLGVNILVLSDEITFLKEFAISSMQNRLLSDITKLVVIGHLNLEDIQVLASYWAVSIMNTLLMIPQKEGLHESMYGGSINISVLPYEPYWLEEKAEDGSVIYSGLDRLMLEAMMSTLNFSVSLLPVRTWDEVFQCVANRSSWVAPVIHFVLPPRLKATGFTWNYEIDANLAFVMVKPLLEAKWQSLYYPLKHEVWILILGILVIATWSLIGFIKVSWKKSVMPSKLGSDLIILEVFGTLLGQGLNSRLPVTFGVRTLLTSWLMFAFIIGIVYKGNLVASLVAPRYPPRPETLEELVRDVERVTMPPFGKAFQDVLIESEVESLKALGNMMQVGIDIEKGLKMTANYRYPHIDSLRFLQHQIAIHHTQADGSSMFYIGREGVMSSVYAWPIPHDAPFKENFDFVILALLEGGFYDKWIHNWLEDARRLGRQKNRQGLALDKLKQENSDENFSMITYGKSDDPKPLTIVHFQGPLLILGVGAYIAAMIFFTEYFELSWSYLKPRCTLWKKKGT